MRTTSTLLAVWASASVLLVGCAPPHEKQAKMPPEPAETLPAWTYDAPYYYRPPPDAVPQPVNLPDPDYPLEYYVRDQIILIDRPANEVPISRMPRIAVWWTSTDGLLWTRAGYFGLGQTHFPLVAGDDGDYGIRFIGPGIRESLSERTVPHRVYHLDTCPPELTLTVEPEESGYSVNQVITIRWTATDLNLDQEHPIQIAVCWSWENPDMRETASTAPVRTEQEAMESRLWRPIDSKFEPAGTLAYTIPEKAAGESFQIQIRAKDRAGNYGVIYSEPILVDALPATAEVEPDEAPPCEDDVSSGPES